MASAMRGGAVVELIVFHKNASLMLYINDCDRWVTV
jgi:hypothetical protein